MVISRNDKSEELGLRRGKAHNAPGLLIVADINSLVQFIQLVLFAPYLGVFELSKSILRHKLPSP